MAYLIRILIALDQLATTLVGASLMKRCRASPTACTSKASRGAASGAR